MCVPSNTYISTSDSRRALLLVLCLLSAAFSLKAQTTGDSCVIGELRRSSLHPLNVELSVYATGGTHHCGRLWKDDYYYATVRGNNGRMHSAYAHVGLSADFSAYKIWSIYSSLGYKQERYAFDWGLLGNTGARTQWLTGDLGISFFEFFNFGVQSDVFLDSRVRSGGNSAYVGFDSNCFRPVSLGIYLGITIALMNASIELRYGFQIMHQLDVEKMAYYNMERTKLKKDFFEIKASYRLFTTKRKLEIYTNE